MYVDQSLRTDSPFNYPTDFHTYKRNLYSVHKRSTMDSHMWVSNSVVEYSAFNRLAVGSNPT